MPDTARSVGAAKCVPAGLSAVRRAGGAASAGKSSASPYKLTASSSLPASPPCMASSFAEADAPPCELSRMGRMITIFPPRDITAEASSSSA
eukprot:CAMPEP_0206050168 /NCGR_PEP_ID=MMETSP1466-20131121/28555_1 /ASSEMBLY_ACC=CAM_ASM_001126 /TAXON_ID=44452 /ORGANISM="Pavlova gyrans, Strain CCMP608" /LENGTH=91 /DNA_ID=CAMNT_0053425275 /DNA_START=30 /DNA_END=302 /DNA_ORIENTATION=+